MVELSHPAGGTRLFFSGTLRRGNFPSGKEASFPPLVRGKVYGRFVEEEAYFPSLFDLVLTLYRIPFQHPAVEDLRDALRSGAERRR
ncbi:MAG TPA: hypothetical protein VF570_16395 [Pyrinomonadaceae bacterium]